MLDRYHPPTNLPENSNILVRIRLSILKCNLSALLKKKEKEKIIIAKFVCMIHDTRGTRLHACPLIWIVGDQMKGSLDRCQFLARNIRP